MVKSELSENHRTRVVVERLERTRAHLLESALLFFSEKGPEAAVIDDVIALAGMSRGSFYNYFRTNEELFEAVAAEISNELLRVIDPVVQLQEDPVAHVDSGMGLLLHAVRKYPLLGAFLSLLRRGTKLLYRSTDAGKRLFGMAAIVRVWLSRCHDHTLVMR